MVVKGSSHATRAATPTYNPFNPPSRYTLRERLVSESLVMNPHQAYVAKASMRPAYFPPVEDYVKHEISIHPQL
jgi:hypothetical protein